MCQVIRSFITLYSHLDYRSCKMGKKKLQMYHLWLGVVKNTGLYLVHGAHNIYLPRLCSDGEAVHLYYTTANSRVYHQEELKSFEVKAEVDE